MEFDAGPLLGSVLRINTWREGKEAAFYCRGRNWATVQGQQSAADPTALPSGLRGREGQTFIFLHQPDTPVIRCEQPLGKEAFCRQGTRRGTELRSLHCQHPGRWGNKGLLPIGPPYPLLLYLRKEGKLSLSNC